MEIENGIHVLYPDRGFDRDGRERAIRRVLQCLDSWAVSVVPLLTDISIRYVLIDMSSSDVDASREISRCDVGIQQMPRLNNMATTLSSYTYTSSKAKCQMPVRVLWHVARCM